MKHLVLFFASLFLIFSCAEDNNLVFSEEEKIVNQTEEEYIIETFSQLLSISEYIRVSLNSPEKIDFETLFTDNNNINKTYFDALYSAGIVNAEIQEFKHQFFEMLKLIKKLEKTNFNSYEIEFLYNKIYNKRSKINTRSCKSDWDSCTQLAGLQYAAGIVVCSSSALIAGAGAFIAGACLVAVGAEFAQDYNGCEAGYQNCIHEK